MSALTITLTPDLDAFVQAQVETAGYVDAGDVVRDALLLLQERAGQRLAKLTVLRSEIQQGFDSGPAEEMDWVDLRRRIREHAQTNSA